MAARSSMCRWMFLTGNQRIVIFVKKSKKGVPMCHMAEISNQCTEHLLASAWWSYAFPRMCVEGRPVVLTVMGNPWCYVWSADHLDFILKSVSCFGEQAIPPRERRSKGRRGRGPALGLADGRFWKGRHPASLGQLSGNRYIGTVSTRTYVVYLTIGNWKWKFRALKHAFCLIIISLESWRKFYCGSRRPRAPLP